MLTGSLDTYEVCQRVAKGRKRSHTVGIERKVRRRLLLGVNSCIVNVQTAVVWVQA